MLLMGSVGRPGMGLQLDMELIVTAGRGLYLWRMETLCPEVGCLSVAYGYRVSQGPPDSALAVYLQSTVGLLKPDLMSGTGDLCRSSP